MTNKAKAPVVHMTIEFEDDGQDFLEWDLDERGVVVDCRPFQADIWCGRTVGNSITLRAGGFVRVVSAKYALGYAEVAHRVKEVRRHDVPGAHPFFAGMSPFGDPMYCTDAADRVEIVRTLDLAGCRRALEGGLTLQKTVTQALQRRMRALERAAARNPA